MSKRNAPLPALTPEQALANDYEPDWTRECDVCGMAPILPITGLCGPCSFGEADTVGGDW